MSNGRLAVLAVDEIAACLVVLLVVVSLHHRDVALAPVDDEGLTNEEQHGGDLGDGEEAPDGSLLHEVVGDEASEHGAKEEQETSLKDHSFLLIEGKERSEHEERVNRCTHNVVRRVCHRHRPAQVHHIGCLECAELVAAEPLGGRVGLGVDFHQVEAREEFFGR